MTKCIIALFNNERRKKETLIFWSQWNNLLLLTAEIIGPGVNKLDVTGSLQQAQMLAAYPLVRYANTITLENYSNRYKNYESEMDLVL